MNLLLTRQESFRSDLRQGGINFVQRQPSSEISAICLGGDVGLLGTLRPSWPILTILKETKNKQKKREREKKEILSEVGLEFKGEQLTLGCCLCCGSGDQHAPVPYLG